MNTKGREQGKDGQLEFPVIITYLLWLSPLLPGQGIVGCIVSTEYASASLISAINCQSFEAIVVPDEG